MKTICIQELKLNAKSLLFWCLGMLLLLAIGVAEFSTCVGTDASIMPMLLAMPKIIRIMFGMNALSIDTPLGYFACMLLWYEFIAFFHAASLGASILAKEERDRTADYLFTKPYSRAAIITGKTLAAVLNLMVLNLVTWGSSLVAFGHADGFAPIYREIHCLMIGMFLIQLLYFAVSLAVSTIVKTPGQATSLSILFVLVGYVIGVGIEYIEKSGWLEILSPFRYFYAAQIAEQGIRGVFILLALAVSALAMALAYHQYEVRDIQA